MGAVIVVEGVSDQIAVETLAARRGIAVETFVLGGAHRIAAFVAELAPEDRARIVGLCDAGEALIFRRALEPTGSPFFVCDADLEDELIRALGIDAVEEVLRANGDLARLRKLQQMPQWRDRDPHAQIRRFLAAGARRKTRYARLLVEALDLDRIPAPLEGLLHAAGTSGTFPASDVPR